MKKCVHTLTYFPISSYRSDTLLASAEICTTPLSVISSMSWNLTFLLRRRESVVWKPHQSQRWCRLPFASCLSWLPRSVSSLILQPHTSSLCQVFLCCLSFSQSHHLFLYCQLACLSGIRWIGDRDRELDMRNSKSQHCMPAEEKTHHLIHTFPAPSLSPTLHKATESETSCTIATTTSSPWPTVVSLHKKNKLINYAISATCLSSHVPVGA